MKAEKIILSFVAVFVGLIAAGVSFYFYQSTRSVPEETPSVASNQQQTNPEPTQPDTNLLTVESPADEAVFDKKTITVKGKTVKDATITVATEESDQVVKPSDNGEFTLTQTVPEGVSEVKVIAIFPDGQEKTVTKTVTYTTESF